jgi:hypothetical protein
LDVAAGCGVSWSTAGLLVGMCATAIGVVASMPWGLLIVAGAVLIAVCA